MITWSAELKLSAIKKTKILISGTKKAGWRMKMATLKVSLLLKYSALSQHEMNGSNESFYSTSDENSQRKSGGDVRMKIY